MKTLNKIKIWWLVVGLIATMLISSKIFPTSMKDIRESEYVLDSLKLKDIEAVAKLDSMSIAYNNALGSHDALSKQLDRNASQQIIIDKRTTNITRNYIMKDTLSKK